MSRFKLPVIPSSIQKAIRFPNSTIERVEKVITGTNYSFSAFVVAATIMLQMIIVINRMFKDKI